MFEIRYVTEADMKFWFTLDRHMSENELLLKIRDKRGYVICDGNKPVGIMRYNLFWDDLPFLKKYFLGKKAASSAASAI